MKHRRSGNSHRPGHRRHPGLHTGAATDCYLLRHRHIDRPVADPGRPGLRDQVRLHSDRDGFTTAHSPLPWMLTVTVTNVDEAGTVTLSTNQPPARAEITAALTDPDEGVTGAVWQWERSSDGNTDWAGIGTSSPSYTPVDGDVGYHLRATASYTDGHGPGKTAQAASTQAVQAGANRPPEFDSATATREVPENTEAGENIGAPVTAADPDTGDTPAYTLEGADLDSFDIDSASGQIQTKSGVTYDHEVKSSYSVTVKADDNNGGTATIDVTITVADVERTAGVRLVETASRDHRREHHGGGCGHRRLR